MDTLAALPSPQQKVAEVASAIERDICVGRLGTGAWLKQIDLEEQYDVSRIVVRQALDRLVERGLVRLVARRGYCVEEMSLDKLRQILGIRAILEIAAAEELMGKLDATQLSRLDQLAAVFAEAVERGTVQEQEAANHGFHAEMLRTCTNRELVRLIFDLRNRVPLAVTRQKNTRPLMERTAREHFEMVACLRSSDMERMRAVIREHILGDVRES